MTPKQQIAAAKRQAAREKAQRAEDDFFKSLEQAGLPLPEGEYIFHPTRNWRMDYAWPDEHVFLEVEGLFGKDARGRRTVSRHRSIEGYLKDMEKYNEAAAMGFRMIRTTPSGLTKRQLTKLLERTLNNN